MATGICLMGPEKYGGIGVVENDITEEYDTSWDLYKGDGPVTKEPRPNALKLMHVEKASYAVSIAKEASERPTLSRAWAALALTGVLVLFTLRHGCSRTTSSTRDKLHVAAQVFYNANDLLLGTVYVSSYQALKANLGPFKPFHTLLLVPTLDRLKWHTISSASPHGSKFISDEYPRGISVDKIDTIRHLTYHLCIVIHVTIFFSQMRPTID
ncbi:hypothetical protein BU17DRAFT_85014 [Hysterangium stoloniferum]|nr:hypothetical protein BU17DRAFT_85014 [Hysterangium stoloniferum]